MPLPTALVRAELDRILASELFSRSERLSSFLRFIVERTLAGDGDSLKEQVIAVELYGKDTSFDTAGDPIVRIDARRLRDKLREFYASEGDAPIVISVPKGHYTPVFVTTVPPNDGIVETVSTAEAPATSFAHRWPIGIAAAILIAATTWIVRSPIDRGPAPRPITVTSEPGSEEDPTLSPDGRFVAFSWGGRSVDVNEDIWIKSVDGEAMRDLTNTPATDEHWPSWSPDGQWIAFSRATKDGPAVVKVSALGGAEETIATDAFQPSWTPDSRGLVMRWYSRTDLQTHLVHQDLETGTRRRLTDSPAGFTDTFPRVSPDGTRLAFVRSGEGRWGIFLAPMAGGNPTLLGEWTNEPISGAEWMPDGRELLASKPTGGIRRLMRIPVHGRGPEVLVPGIPYETAGLSVSRVGTGSSLRVAASVGKPNVGLRLVDLATLRADGAIAADSPFCDATRMDAPGRFSPDGQQVAFVSSRSGSLQLWVANRDGSALRSLTRLEDATVSLGSWSPDGGSLTFAATIRQHTDIYVVAAGGGAVRRLGDGTAQATDPEWSRDGRWIYFSSNRSGSQAIWKMTPDASSVKQLTSEAGFDPRETPDGRTIYFVDKARSYGLDSTSMLKRVSVDGGPVEVVDLRVTPGAWDAADSGIVFAAERSEGVQNSRGGRNVLQQYDFADGRIRTIARLGFLIGPFGATRFLTVSRDGRWALASHIDRWERDILVLDGFR